MAAVVLEHHDPGAGGTKARACQAPVVRTVRVVQMQPDVGMPLVKVLKSRQWGQSVFFFIFLALLGDQELISSPSLGLSFLPCTMDSDSCPAHFRG